MRSSLMRAQPASGRSLAHDPGAGPDAAVIGRALRHGMPSARTAAVAHVAAKAGNRAAATLARYPASTEQDSFTKDWYIDRQSGRPQRFYGEQWVLERIVGRVYGPTPSGLSHREQVLRQQHPGQPAQAVDDIINNRWLSLNNAAICHKHAISDIETKIISYANSVLWDPVGVANAGIEAQAIAWAKALTADPVDSTVQQNLMLAIKMMLAKMQQSGATAKGIKEAMELKLLCDRFTEWANCASTNFYIGDSSSNSAIHDFFDPHYNHDPNDVNQVTATPYSRGIYVAEHEFSTAMTTYGGTFTTYTRPSSPVRDTGWVRSSSFDRYNIGDYADAQVGPYVGKNF